MWIQILQAEFLYIEDDRLITGYKVNNSIFVQVGINVLIDIVFMPVMK